MRFPNRYRFSVVAIVLAIASFQPIAHASAVVFSAGGVNSAAIQGTVDAFRTLVGNPNNGNAPGLLTGRREINWDGGGSTLVTSSGTPLAAFQDIRGALLTTPGTGFVQTPVADLVTVFSNPTYSSLFQPFSPVRVFTPVGSNITDVTFSVPGTNGLTSATVTAFGAVFSDVDLANSTSIQYFDRNGLSLGTFFAPAGVGASQSLSFLGVAFNAGETVARVRITSGNAALSPTSNEGAAVDLVVMDDFIYSEPRAVPEPSTLILLSAGLLGIRVARRRSHGNL